MISRVAPLQITHIINGASDIEHSRVKPMTPQETFAGCRTDQIRNFPPIVIRQLMRDMSHEVSYPRATG
jgi:hypothetical protein